ncbi:MAG: 4a-hydroxytetrahydrobiopterin dehydratase [Rubricoccaceae bacterium]|nr:4a-hydroxytetrahydrobiopterin dehydratase [Rubricoccaceae bacterium]
MTYEVLSDDKIRQALSDLDGWELRGSAITKAFSFGSFQEAVAFIVRMSYICEAHNHHPELTNVYNQVTLSFSTHDAGDVITDRDVAVASEIDTLQ